MDTASKATLDDEFGTHKDDDVILQIMERGTIVESEVSRTHVELSSSVR